MKTKLKTDGKYFVTENGKIIAASFRNFNQWEVRILKGEDNIINRIKADCPTFAKRYSIEPPLRTFSKEWAERYADSMRSPGSSDNISNGD